MHTPLGFDEDDYFGDESERPLLTDEQQAYHDERQKEIDQLIATYASADSPMTW